MRRRENKQEKEKDRKTERSRGSRKNKQMEEKNRETERSRGRREGINRSKRRIGRQREVEEGERE
jgi:hypothetical protein